MHFPCLADGGDDKLRDLFRFGTHAQLHVDAFVHIEACTDKHSLLSVVNTLQSQNKDEEEERNKRGVSGEGMEKHDSEREKLAEKAPASEIGRRREKLAEKA